MVMAIVNFNKRQCTNRTSFKQMALFPSKSQPEDKTAFLHKGTAFSYLMS
jgi:hypothetical protein